MPRLITLGGLTLQLPAEGDALVRQRRKLALLCVLARSRRPTSRDVLAEMLWGEEPDERARHSLAEALSNLRRVLGRDAVSARAADVALAPGVLSVDATEFETACERGDWEAAVAVYAGPFLDGVCIDRAPSFEQWADAERARLARLFERACQAHGVALMRARDYAAAVALAARWLDAEPCAADAALLLLSAHKAPGTREAVTAALAAYAALADRLRRTFDTEPDAAVVAAGARLRDDLARHRLSPEVALPRVSVPIDAVAPPSFAPALLPATSLADVAPGPVLDAAPDPVRDPTPDAAPVAIGHAVSVDPGRRPRRRWIAAATLAGAVAILATVTARGTSAPRGPVERPWVVVADVDDPVLDSTLDRVVPFALAAGVVQAGDVDIVPADRVRTTLQLMRRAPDAPVDEAAARDVAARLGASAVLVPGVVRAGDAYVLTARLVDVRGGAPLGTDVARAGRTDDLLAAVDALARRVRARLGEPEAALRRDPPLPLVTTASLPALRAYADGDRAHKHGDYAEAAASYNVAVTLDSTFATALAALGSEHYWLNAPADGEKAFAAALRHTDRLTPRERMTVAARHAQWLTDYQRAAALREEWLAEHPADRDVLGSLAYTYLRAKRLPDAIATLTRLFAVDSTDAIDWINFATAHAGLRTVPHARQAVAAYHRAFALDSGLRTKTIINHEYGAAWLAAGFPDSAAAAYRLMLTRSAPERASGVRSLAMLAMWRGAYAEAADSLRVAAGLHNGGKDDRSAVLSEARDRLYRRTALLALGRDADADVELRAVRDIARHKRLDPTFESWIVRALARSGRMGDALALRDSLRAQITLASPEQRSSLALAEGEIALAEGRHADAERQLDSGLVNARAQGAFCKESRAWAAWRRGDLAAAATRYAVLDSGYRFGSEGQELTVSAPYWLGRIAEARGDASGARRQYARFLARYATPDPGLVLVADARRRTDALPVLAVR
ncbi:MAG TPA: BTAD domain-containing putative transcriptional regulator [Gemmatirosa sp.]